MKVVISGGTGFIGQALTSYFLQAGAHIVIISRTKKTSADSQLTYITWEMLQHQPSLVTKTDVWINLCGESINSGRWTTKRKQRILQSRLTTTTEIISIFKKLDYKPKLFLNASAIGYFGTSLEATFTEQNPHVGNDFLAQTVLAWEKAASEAISLGIRTCFLRFGIVLGKEGGALPRMVLPYKLYVGGQIGSGKQWISWIHIEDLCRLVDFIISTPSLSGPIHVVAPTPVTMKEFGKTLGAVLSKPHYLPVPSWALKLLLGEMSTLILEGQRVIPEKSMNQGFTFKYTTLSDALHSILK